MLIRHRAKALMGALVSAVLLSACEQTAGPGSAGSASEPIATTSHNIPKPSEYQETNLPANAPTYVVGTMGSYAPMEFRDEYGQSIGFDMDIIYAIAARQQFHITVLTHPWTGMLNTLNTNERDIIISSVNITPERAEVYEFTQPYFALQDIILVKASNNKIHKFEDLVTNQSKIAALSGSAQYSNMLEQNVKDENIMLSETQFLALKDLFGDRAEAAIGDGPVMEYYALNYPDIPTRAFTLPNPKTEYFGIAVKKGNTELRNKLNAGLKQIYEEGVYDKIYFKWFNRPVPKDFLPWAVG